MRRAEPHEERRFGLIGPPNSAFLRDLYASCMLFFIFLVWRQPNRKMGAASPPCRGEGGGADVIVRLSDLLSPKRSQMRSVCSARSLLPLSHAGGQKSGSKLAALQTLRAIRYHTKLRATPKLRFAGVLCL